MRPPKKSLFTVIQGICVFVLLIAAAFRGAAQISSSDSSLRLWLQAGNIDPDLLNSGVTNWTDSSSYGTVMAPPPLPSGDGGTLSNRIPQLIMVTNNGISFQAVQFRQAFDPLSGGDGHYADRLWQTNNLDENDPTLIDSSSDLTLFFVYQNNNPNGALGGSQCIFAKRGPSASPYEFGFNASSLEHMFVTYAGSVAYPSTNEVPAAPEWGLIEMNVTAGGVLTFREYYPSHNGWETSVTPCARGGQSVGTPVTLGFHTQGAGGDANNPWGNGTSERFAGYVAEVALYNRTLSSNETASIENSLLTKYFLQPGPPQITKQPQPQSVFAGSPASFSVLADGTPPFTYQWLFNGAPINGANSQSYSIASAGGADAGTYSVIVSNGISFATSSGALLTVQTNSLTLLSALRDYTAQTSVTVNFSAAIDPTTAANPANYSINNGVTVSAVTLVTNAGSIKSAVLTTSPVTVSPSILMVTNVLDGFNNPIAANSTATIPIPSASVGTPPLANCLLWLAGDQGLLADNIGIYEWDDHSGAANEHDAVFAGGNAHPAQFAFPNAMHPVANFDGTAWLQLDNSLDFQLTNFTIYVVGDVNNTKASDDFAGLWTGWGLGINDGTAGVVKWVTFQPDSNNDTQSPDAAKLGNRVPYLVEGAFTALSQKSLTINGTTVASESTNGGISYGGSVVTIGALNAGGAQPLVGDIAEMLIYSNVSPAQDAAVRQYIQQKYFTPSLTVPALVSAARDPNVQTSVSVSFTEAVSPTTATNVANYSINQGITISSITFVNPTNVVLNTSAIAPGPSYVLTVNGVSDWAGNTIAANSTIPVVVTQADQHIYIGMQAGQISLTWSNAASVLQSTTTLPGPWTNVTGATSPFVVTNATDKAFFKLQ